MSRNTDATFTAEKIGYYPFHTKDSLRILYALKGEVLIINVSGSTSIKEGEIEFININEPAQIQAVSDDNIIITLHISRDYLKRFEKRVDTTTYNISSAQFFLYDGRNKTEKNLQNKENFTILFKELFSDYCKYGYILTENLNVLISMIVRCFNDINKHIDYMSNSDSHVIERFANIESYIIENLDKKIKLEDLAASEYLSPQYISSEFRKKFNTTFNGFIEYYRTRKAVKLIIEEDIKTSQIVRECGFSDNKYFYKAIKKHLGYTPLELRKKIQSDGPAITKYYTISKDWTKYFDKKREYANNEMILDEDRWITLSSDCPITVFDGEKAFTLMSGSGNNIFLKKGSKILKKDNDPQKY